MRVAGRPRYKVPIAAAEEHQWAVRRNADVHLAHAPDDDPVIARLHALFDLASQ